VTVGAACIRRVTGSDHTRVEIDGRPANADALALIEHHAWGHFTAMQVRDGRTRGLDLHLARLQAAHRAMYGAELDGTLIRDRVRHALDGTPDASVRVYGYWAGLIVTVRRPETMPARPHAQSAIARAYDGAPQDAI
jgi:branched-subunit amino acid aminotransferase/4-amino-4-deoxychorismate lyase